MEVSALRVARSEAGKAPAARPVCAACTTWHNICHIYEFLTSGVLSAHSPAQADLPTLANTNKLIRNPIDPSEAPDWDWDYKSAQHYKLLKLKLNLQSQASQLAMAYCPMLKEASGDCEPCRTLPGAKLALINRLVEYVDEWKSRLERHFDRFKQTRLRTGYEVKNLNDLGSFMRQGASGSPAESAALKRVDNCSLHIFNLLDLLVDDSALMPYPGSQQQQQANHSSTSCRRSRSSSVSSSSTQLNSGQPTGRYYSQFSGYNSASRATNGTYTGSRGCYIASKFAYQSVGSKVAPREAVSSRYTSAYTPCKSRCSRDFSPRSRPALYNFECEGASRRLATSGVTRPELNKRVLMPDENSSELSKSGQGLGKELARNSASLNGSIRRAVLKDDHLTKVRSSVVPVTDFKRARRSGDARQRPKKSAQDTGECLSEVSSSESSASSTQNSANALSSSPADTAALKRKQTVQDEALATKKQRDNSKCTASETKEKTQASLELSAEASTTVAAAVPTEPSLIVLVDFQLVISRNTSGAGSGYFTECQLCSNQASKELDELSDILPLISHKLTNMNLPDYMADFSRKFLLIREYESVVGKILDLMGEDRQKQPGACADPEETVKRDFECKLQLMQRLIDECLARLLLQNAYLAEVKEVVGRRGADGEQLQAWLKEARKRLYAAQMSLVEFARARLDQGQCLVRNLSFYCLVDVLNRFFAAYNIKLIDFAE